MSSSVGQFWYWKFYIFLSLEKQVSRSLHTLCFWLSLWILRVSFLKVLQPFKKFEFPARLGNVLQNLQVIWSFSYNESWQNREAMNPETVFWHSFLLQRPFWFHSYSLTRRTGVYYFNIVNGWGFWLLTCSCDSVIIITLSL